MPGTDLRGLPPWLLRAPHGERLGGGRSTRRDWAGGQGPGEGEGRSLGFQSGRDDGRGCRRLCSWTPRCSWLCSDGCSRVRTSTCSRWASGLCSTCPSGSCASSPAPCPSPRCCASGTPSSVRVSGQPEGTPGLGALGCAQGRARELCSAPPATANPGPGRGCQSVLRAMGRVGPGGTAQPLPACHQCDDWPLLPL